ncbi:hypothetical protein NO2_1330 [Candidatus Termititenax persephonae]|uniref:Uncharacterized protein n=1 Tax=Candidatus Termititenax persephonae TaxID=2218525 RepID=A0A388TI34_9BACT|nr:hypothetical protein NO2_1330 [Candidatus Termititenax persephonae]
MAIVRSILDITKPIPQEVIERVRRNLKGRKIDLTDPDNPPLTAKELREMAAQTREIKKKIMFSLRMSKPAILWWQSLGKGYTGLMTTLLEAAPRHPEWIKTALNTQP